MNWDDIRLFLTTAEEGSFRQAAGKLNLGHSTLSRRIDALEHDLGTKLFNRQSRGLTLTPAGKEMLDTAVSMNQQFDQLQIRMFGQDKTPRGNIKLTVPGLLLNYLLIDSLNRFCEEWPEISIDVNTSLSLLDLSAKEADIAIRMTNHPGEQLIGRKIGVYCEAAYASEIYLENFTNQNERVHQWIHPGGDYKFEAELANAYTTEQEHKIQLVVPDIDAQMHFAERHVGIAMLPCLMADRNPQLKRISSIVHRSDIWLLAHKDSRENTRMQLFREFLVDVFAQHQERMLGK